MDVRRKAATLVRPVLIALICFGLAGCGGVVALLAPYLMLKDWEDWFSDDDEAPADYEVFVDGYEVGTLGDASGVLNLNGVTARDYLVTVARPPAFTRGLQALVSIAQNGSVDLRQQNLFEGGAISGTVRRDSTGGVLMPAVRVFALRGGSTALASSGTTIALPAAAGSGREVMMGYTDDTGSFRLGPALYGDWLVFATSAGYFLDAVHVTVSSTRNGTANLVLQPDATVQTGVVTGAVSRSGGLLDSPLVTAFLQTPYVPQITAETRNDVIAASGLTLPAGAWFSFDTLTTIAPGTRDFSLTLPVGTHDLEAYAFNYRASSTIVGVTQGAALVQDFVLSHR